MVLTISQTSSKRNGMLKYYECVLHQHNLYEQYNLLKRKTISQNHKQPYVISAIYLPPGRLNDLGCQSFDHERTR
jgi:hypothetical protein